VASRHQRATLRARGAMPPERHRVAPVVGQPKSGPGRGRLTGFPRAFNRRANRRDRHSRGVAKSSFFENFQMRARPQALARASVICEPRSGASEESRRRRRATGRATRKSLPFPLPLRGAIRGDSAAFSPDAHDGQSSENADHRPSAPLSKLTPWILLWALPPLVARATPRRGAPPSHVLASRHRTLCPPHR